MQFPWWKRQKRHSSVVYLQLILHGVRGLRGVKWGQPISLHYFRPWGGGVEVSGVVEGCVGVCRWVFKVMV